MNEEKKREKRIRYIKTACAMTVCVILCFVIINPFGEEGVKNVIGKISDCFIVPGVLFSGISLLSYVSYLGGYDSFGYAFSKFGLHNLWFTRQSAVRYESYYEYKQAKHEKGRKWFPHLLIFGLSALVLGVILLVVYLCIP